MRRVVAFVAGDDAALRVDFTRLVRDARVPLKNTNADSVDNVIELAQIARERFPFMAPSLPRDVVAKLDELQVLFFFF